MQNIHLWKPSKFIEYKGSFRTNKDQTKAGIGSRLIGDIQAKNYSKLIKKHAHGILLDLGCGEVPLFKMYKPYVDEIYCTDWPNSNHDLVFLDFKLNLNKPFPISDSTFDTIILTDVLEHISKPELIWYEIARILKIGGKVIIGVPFFHYLHEEPFDYFRYTEFRLRMYCEENNLKVIELYPYGASLEIFFDLISKHIANIKLISYLNYLVGRFLINSPIGKKIYLRTSSKFPLGYCLVVQK